MTSLPSLLSRSWNSVKKACSKRPFDDTSPRRTREPPKPSPQSRAGLDVKLGAMPRCARWQLQRAVCGGAVGRREGSLAHHQAQGSWGRGSAPPARYRAAAPGGGHQKKRPWISAFSLK